MNIKVHMLEDKMCRIIDTDNYSTISVNFNDKIVVFTDKSGNNYIYPGDVTIEFGPFDDVPDKFTGDD